MVNDIREQKIEHQRTTVFIEPGAFKCDYEEICGLPFFHFVFLDKPSSTLIKMLQIVCEEAAEEVWYNGYDYIFSYTERKNKSVIKAVKLLGFEVINEVEDFVILRKEIKNG